MLGISAPKVLGFVRLALSFFFFFFLIDFFVCVCVCACGDTHGLSLTLSLCTVKWVKGNLGTCCLAETNLTISLLFLF